MENCAHRARFEHIVHAVPTLAFFNHSLSRAPDTITICSSTCLCGSLLKRQLQIIKYLPISFYPFYLCIYIYIYNKTTLNRPIMGPTLSGAFRKMVGLRNSNICMGDHFAREIK